MNLPRSPRSFRRDGWTIRRQLAFLDALGRTHSVTAAARVAGMSRESAYRLRRRPTAALFAAAWDRALQAPRPSPRPRRSQDHKRAAVNPWREARQDFEL